MSAPSSPTVTRGRGRGKGRGGRASEGSRSPTPTASTELLEKRLRSPQSQQQMSEQPGSKPYSGKPLTFNPACLHNFIASDSNILSQNTYLNQSQTPILTNRTCHLTAIVESTLNILGPNRVSPDGGKNHKIPYYVSLG